MRKLAMTVFALEVLACGLAAAQVDTAWVRRYNRFDVLDIATAVTVDGSGGVYVTGRSDGVSTLEDFATIRYTARGDTVWVRRYNSSTSLAEGATAIAVDRAGNVFVTGFGQGNDDYDYVTIKYYPSGDTAWVRRYSAVTGPYLDQAHAVAVDSQGNAYVTGTSYHTATGYDYATVKYSPDGIQRWVARYAGPGCDVEEAYCIGVDPGGSVYVTGSSGTVGRLDYATVKYDSAGAESWVRRYNDAGLGTAYPYGLAFDPSGNVCVTGETFTTGRGLDYATIKYRPSGDTAWVRTYNSAGANGDAGRTLAVDPAGNVCVTGLSQGPGGNTDYLTIRYDSAGAEQWTARYNGPGNIDDVASGIVADSFGNTTVTGWSWGLTGQSDYATVLYSASGGEEWVARYDGPTGLEDHAQAIAIDGWGNVVVTGYSAGAGTGEDYCTIKYGTAGAVVEATSAEVRTTNFSPTIVRGVLFPPSSLLSPPSSLLSIDGRKVARLVAGPNDVSHLSPGVYFLRQASSVTKLVVTR